MGMRQCAAAPGCMQYAAGQPAYCRNNKKKWTYSHVALDAKLRAQRGHRRSPVGCPPALVSCSSVVWQMGQARWNVGPVLLALLLLEAAAAAAERGPEAAAAPPPVCGSAACCAAWGLSVTTLLQIHGKETRTEAGEARELGAAATRC